MHVCTYGYTGLIYECTFYIFESISEYVCVYVKYVYMYVCTVCMYVCMYADDNIIFFSDGSIQRYSLRSHSEAEYAGSQVRTYSPAAGALVS